MNMKVGRKVRVFAAVGLLLAFLGLVDAQFKFPMVKALAGVVEETADFIHYHTDAEYRAEIDAMRDWLAAADREIERNGGHSTAWLNAVASLRAEDLLANGLNPGWKYRLYLDRGTLLLQEYRYQDGFLKEDYVVLMERSDAYKKGDFLVWELADGPFVFVLNHDVKKFASD